MEEKRIDYIKALRDISEAKKVAFELPVGEKKLKMTMKPPTDRETMEAVVAQAAKENEILEKLTEKGLDKKKALNPKEFSNRAEEIAVSAGRVEFVRICLPYLLEYPQGGRIFQTDEEMKVFDGLPTTELEFLYTKFAEINAPLGEIKNLPVPPAGSSKTQ